MLATTMRRSATEMGYNLIRMHIMSGHLAVNVRDYHRGWKCCLDVLHSPPSEINSADSHSVPMCGRAPWYWHLSTIVRGALEASPPRVAFMTAQRRDVNHHLSPGICRQPAIQGRCETILNNASVIPEHNAVPPSDERKTFGLR